MKRHLVAAVIVCFVCCFPVVLQADFLQYTITGVIPDGASDHSEISDGETWTAVFAIDTTVADQDPGDTTFGSYPGAVIDGTLVFSGGYTSPFDFSSADIIVGDDFFQDVFLDAVQVNDGINFFQTSNTVDLDSLNSDGLPPSGTSFMSAPADPKFNWGQLTYTDSNGTVVYGGLAAHNTSFSAVKIPEPSSTALLGICLIAAWMRRRQ